MFNSIFVRHFVLSSLLLHSSGELDQLNQWRMTSIFLNLLLKNVPYIYLVVSSSDTLVVINQMFYLADTGD